jgi:hypothetical protein
MSHKETLTKLSSQELIDLFKNKSNAIRYLASYEFTKSEIAKMLNLRYQHVRNVLLQKLNKEVTIEDLDAKISDLSKDKDQYQLDI